VFSGVFIAEEVDGIGDKGLGDTTTGDVQMLLETFLNMSLRSACFNDGGFFLVKSRTPGWKNHIDQMVPKLSGACYAVRSMYHISNINTLKPIYFAYFHSIIKYGIIFWGNSSNSTKIFTLQEKLISIMAGAQPRTPCRSLFKKIRDFSYSMSIYIFINELYFKQSRKFSNKFIYTQYRHQE
jgi:hypothetical protein